MHRQIAGKLTGPRTKYVVVVFWLLAVVALGGFAGKLTEVQNNEASSWLPASAESTRGFESMSPFQSPNAIPTTLVYTSTTVTGADLAEVASGDIAALGELDGVEGEIEPPLLSRDGEVAQVTVTFDLGSDGWNKMPGIVDDIREIADHDDVRLHVTGQGGSAADAAEAFGGIDTTLLLAALAVVVVILLFVYRSPVLWLFPIVSVVVGLGVTMGLVYFLAKEAGLTVNGQSQAILSILAIGAGTDYALLLVSRYREELRNFEDRHDAMAHALHRAAPAILASAVTVILAMLCLTVAEMNSTAGMGPVVAVGIGVTYLVMVTLLPALLVICGRWVFWPMRPAYRSAEPTETGLWAKVGAMVSVRPRVVWIVTTGILLIACLGLLRLDANGLASDETYTKEFDSITGQQVLVDHDMADQSNQLLVVADSAAQGQVQQALDGVEGLVPTETPAGEMKGFPLGPPQDGVVAIAAVVDADVTSPEAYDIVDSARSAVHGVDGSGALVTGTSAMMLDTLEASQRDNLVIIPIVLVVVLLVLMVLLRAVVAPLILLGTVILSFGAALGISVLLFEFVFGFAGADPGFPLFAFVFLVALGIDYNIFLMTRVREEAQVRGTWEGSLVALTSTGGVITSAGVVLAATFLVLGSLPMVFLAEIGVTVALGVMLDTMIVRSILVTAINLDAGDRIWWPSRLAKPKQQ
ncbi:MMPL family transporter [Nocardioides sp. NPDC101246]|uniref:MMPL family transporter n=1 Tax=Nocardioides sp. NPDC101246 TaxID=3364336 RepID=UPI0037FA3813